VERSEPFWPALAAVAGALGLYVTLPHRLIMGPSRIRRLALTLIGVIGRMRCRSAAGPSC
jgi:hypothetical protein